MKQIFKRTSTFLLLAGTLAWAASTSPRVSRATLAAMEKSFDNQVNALWDDNPFLLLGTTRGVYLDGYGAVFTAEVNLVPGPTSMMHPTATKEEAARYRVKKLERIPQLREALRKNLMSTASSLDTVPADENIVMVVFVSRYNWEDSSGMPVQITMQAKRKSLVDAKRAGGSGLDQIIKVTEY